MPLYKGCSVILSKANYSKLLSEGYTKGQSYIISLKQARKYKNMCNMPRKIALQRGELFNNYPSKNW